MNLGRGYARNVNVILFLGYNALDSCSVHFDVIGPGESLPILCQIEADKCYIRSKAVTLNQSLSSCEYLSADEYSNQQSIINEDTEGQDIIHGAEGYDTLVEEPADDQGVTVEDLMPVLAPILDDVKAEWVNKVAENPCQPDQAETAYETWVGEKAKALSDASGQLVGDGMPWATLETFRDWLIVESHIDEQGSITKTWKDDFDITNSALDRCQACAPPSMIGTISLTVDLKTCAVEGEISATGEGDVTVNDCINGQPIAATCTSHGTMSFSGKITGKTDKDGVLTLDQTFVSTDYSSGWVEGCDWASREIEKEHWDDDPVDITGFIDWQGSATGTFKYASTVCSLDGNWNVNAE